MYNDILIVADLPTGRDARDRVSIILTEIASFQSHVVTSYSYEDWTKITLKNGEVIDCRISYDDFVRRIKMLVEAP